MACKRWLIWSFSILVLGCVWNISASFAGKFTQSIQGDSQSLESKDYRDYATLCSQEFEHLFIDKLTLKESNGFGASDTTIHSLSIFENGYRQIKNFDFGFGVVWPQTGMVDMKIFVTLTKPSNGWTEFAPKTYPLICTFLNQKRGKPTRPSYIKFCEYARSVTIHLPDESVYSEVDPVKKKLNYALGISKGEIRRGSDCPQRLQSLTP